eukprot:7166143-Prymnesium_polylepis.1
MLLAAECELPVLALHAAALPTTLTADSREVCTRVLGAVRLSLGSQDCGGGSEGFGPLVTEACAASVSTGRPCATGCCLDSHKAHEVVLVALLPFRLLCHTPRPPTAQRLRQWRRWRQ